jgi:hypothetical protein
LPESCFGQLPVRHNELFNEKEALLLLSPGLDTRDWIVLRLWAANPNVEKDKAQLWLGTIHGLDVLTLAGLVHVPLQRTDYSQSLAQFRTKAGVLLRQLRVRQQYYPNIGMTESWQGEVLMLEFAAADISSSGSK